MGPELQCFFSLFHLATYNLKLAGSSTFILLLKEKENSFQVIDFQASLKQGSLNYSRLDLLCIGILWLIILSAFVTDHHSKIIPKGNILVGLFGPVSGWNLLFKA